MNSLIERVLAEKHRLFKQFLGFTPDMVDALSNTIGPVAMFLSHVAKYGTFFDIVPALGHLFHGHDDHPSSKVLANKLDFVTLSYTTSRSGDISAVVVKRKDEEDADLVMAPPTHKLWLHNPQAIHAEIAPGVISHSIYVYPHTFPCLHTEHMSEVCALGYVHHGLFYVENVADKLALLEAAADRAVAGKGVELAN